VAQHTVLVRYFGSVQGVGFRATARRIAQGYQVSGWVKNEADGSVSMIATSTPEEVDAFLKALRGSRLGSLISREVVEAANPVNAQGFDILH
jgi:acylphosphatase